MTRGLRRLYRFKETGYNYAADRWKGLFPDAAPDADLVDPCVAQCSVVDGGPNSLALYNAQFNCYNVSGPGFTLCNETATSACYCP